MADNQYYAKSENKWACFDYAAGFIDVLFKSYISEYSRINHGAVDVPVMSHTSELTIAAFNYIKYMWRKDSKHETPDEDIKKANEYLSKMAEISSTFANYFEKMYKAYDDDAAYDEIKALKNLHVEDVQQAYAYSYGGPRKSTRKYNSGAGSKKSSSFDDDLFNDGFTD